MIMTERSSSFATTSRQSLKRPREADSVEDFSLASVVYSFITSYLPLRHDPRPSPDMPTTRSNTATASSSSSSSSAAPSSSSKPATTSSATPPPLLPPPYLMETPPRPLKRIRLGPIHDPQPTPEHLLATYGIKTRDFAYESKLPPVPAYRRPQVLDVDDEPEGISRMGAYMNLEDAPSAFLQPPTSPMRGVERSPPNGQSTQSQGASSQRRRSLEREATEPVGEDAFSQPQRALPPPSRALPPTRKLFADYQAQFDQPTSQPSQQDVTPPSSPGPLAGHSQPTDDEDQIATPLVTPNGSLLYPMDLDQEPIDVDAMMVDAPQPDVIDLTRLPMAEDDYTYSQYGSPVRDALSSPRTPPPAWSARPVGKRSPLRREEAFIGTTQLLLNHSPVTPPPPAARSPRFPVSPASTTGKRTPPVIQSGNTPHRPSPLGNGTHANSRGQSAQVRSPPHVVLSHTARLSRTPHSSAAPTPPPSAQGEAAGIMRSYNLRKRGVSPESEESTKRVLRSSRASSVHPPQTLAAVRARSRTPANKPVSAAAAVVPPTPPASQSEARRGAQSQPPRTMPRAAFTIRSAHGAVDAAMGKTGRTIREVQADKTNERPLSGGKRVLRARKA